jgi:hypothetical protein
MACWLYVESHPEDFKTWDRALSRLRTSKSIHLWGFGSILEKGYADGALPFHRTEMHVQIDPERGEAIINATRFAGDGTKAEDLTRAEIALRGQVKALVAHMSAMAWGGGRSISSELAPADRPHCHSGIFFSRSKLSGRSGPIVS